MEPETVVLVHGLWMTGLELGLLAHRLGRCGFRTVRFPYSSLRAPLSENVVRLEGFLQRLDAPVLHLIGHSLGGLVILGLLRHYRLHRPGRVVLLGTPLGGCYAVRYLARTPWGRLMLGRSVCAEFSDGVPGWDGGRELGIIAGTHSLGMGRVLVPGLPQPNDGAVVLGETELPGAVDRIVLPVSHMGMLVSAEVARQVCAFLRSGGFRRAGAA